MARSRSIRADISFIEIEYTDIDEDQLWEPGHMIYDWCVDISETLERFTKSTAPPTVSHARWPRKSSGALKAGIHAFGKRTGSQSYDIVLMSAAPYTMYVHGGTAYRRGGKYIYSTAGYANREFIDWNIDAWHEGNIDPTSNMPTGEGRFHILPIHGNMFMVLPPGAGHSRRFHLRVRGQLPNAFLYRGWNRTDEEHHGELGAMVHSPLGFAAPPGVGKLKP